MRLRVKRRHPKDHLINKDPKCPPIIHRVMTIPNNNLGRKILRRPTERVRCFSFLQELPKSIINQRHISLLIEKYVLRLKVSVDYVVFVQMPKCQNDLGRVEQGLVFRESFHLP